MRLTSLLGGSMRVWFLAPVLALTLFAASVLPQQSLFSRVPQQPFATGAIEGVVVRADTGELISGAQVSLSGGIGPAPPTVAVGMAISPVIGAVGSPPAGVSV